MVSNPRPSLHPCWRTSAAKLPMGVRQSAHLNEILCRHKGYRIKRARFCLKIGTERRNCFPFSGNRSLFCANVCPMEIIFRLQPEKSPPRFRKYFNCPTQIGGKPWCGSGGKSKRHSSLISFMWQDVAIDCGGEPVWRDLFLATHQPIHRPWLRNPEESRVFLR